MFKWLTSENVDLFTEPAAIQRAGVDVTEVERIVGIRRGSRMVWQDGLPRSADSLTTRQVRLNRKLGERVFEWYKTVHADPDFSTPYMCFNFVLACLKGIQPNRTTQVLVHGSYEFAQPHNPTELKAGRGYKVVPPTGAEPTHGVVAVDKQNVLHVTGSNGMLAYSTAVAALAMYPGELQGMRQISGVGYKVSADYEWVRPAEAA